MLELKNIVKNYPVIGGEIKVLKGIDVSFRKSEFVSILGPSGCGKTTLLNIIGGLDKYTSGDLLINSTSTKEFKDRDWDNYRNHRIGFIFQSYNLIPHQTVLENVSLALSISGMKKAERTQKAKKALEKVGLLSECNKKPNQLSGGQCQRVAIARALVNDPEILLADEPTGALDTVTSVQIMDLIKEIAKDRLVIMVTHNPELAETYSTRIIKLVDGNIISDSNPYDNIEEKNTENILDNSKYISEEEKSVQNKKKTKKKERAKMSFFTAFKLSIKNLFSKKTRTILTAFAGAIGIIGISFVLAISHGIRSYIASMQDDMLSGNPIQISQTAYDFNSIMDMSMQEKAEAIKTEGFVNVNSLIEYLVNSSNQTSLKISNDITEEYISFVQDMPKEYYASIFLDYGIEPSFNIYTSMKESESSQEKQMSVYAIKNLYSAILNETEYKSYSSMIDTLDSTFMQAPNDEEYILSQYNLLHGEIAKNKNDVMIVVNSDRQLTDVLLAQLGYYTQEEFLTWIDGIDNGESMNEDKFSYQELVNKKFTWYNNDTVFIENTNQFTKNVNPFYYNAYKNESFENGIELNVVGILEPKENISYGCLTSGFYYTEALTEEIITQNLTSKICEYLRNGESSSINSTHYDNNGVGVDLGITYQFSFNYNETNYNKTGFVGSTSMMSSIMGMMGGGGSKVYTLNLTQVGGVNLANSIRIYPTNFEEKDNVLKYLDVWNSESDIVVNNTTITKNDRTDVTYTDNLSLVIAIINGMIDIVTYALVGFTGLSLIVSCVMIGIITHVSVVDRTKEIGVIRSLGGRKHDVTNLFNAETFIIGTISGLFGIGVTYLLSFIANSIVSKLASISAIAIFPINYALIMLTVSIVLTVISGLIPARSAAKKDPVVALRTE